MKKHLNKLLVAVGLGLLILTSCKKQESVVSYVGSTPLVLTATDSTNNILTTIPLIPNDSFHTAVVFHWTNPNYQFSNGVSPFSVSYYLEFDTLGANFSSGSVVQRGIFQKLDTAFTVYDFNILAANTFKLDTGIVHTIQVRVVSFLTSNTAGSPNILPITSNVLNVMCIPYAPPPPPPVVTPPSTGTLYIVGSAVAGGWSNPIPSSDIAAQQFAKISTTEYKLTTTLGSGQEYKFIGKNDGAWAAALNFGIATKDDPTEVNGGAFFASGGSQNILAPTSTVPTTLYDIDVNFKTGMFTVTPH